MLQSHITTLFKHIFAYLLKLMFVAQIQIANKKKE